MSFEIIRSNFLRGLWDEINIRLAVTKGVITEEQYQSLIEEKSALEETGKEITQVKGIAASRSIRM